MIKNAELHSNGVTPVPTRLALNRLGPQKGSAPHTVAKRPGESIGHAEDLGQGHLNARKMAEDKARARTVARAQAVAEKLSAATEQVASAITEASGAVEELEKTMHTIAAGADQASAAAEESRAAINQIEKASDSANGRAQTSLQRVNESQALARSTTIDIDTLIKGVGDAADANLESAKMISELERQSEEIGKIVHAVTRIADQTNLLALNAAIEAARAGEHGKGFAVVADEVRNLAEISEKSARGIQEVVNEIQNQVKVVAADTEAAGKKGREEVEKAKVITLDLLKVASDFEEIQANCTEIQKSATEALAGAKLYLKGAEEIAAAAEEATSACQEAQKSAQEQSKAYSEMSDAARSLAEMAEALKTSTNAQKSAEELAATAEELSTNAEELKASSQQISVAVEQINKAGTAQAKAAEASNALGTQMRGAAKAMSDRAEASVEKALGTQKVLAGNKVNVDALIVNVGRGADACGESARNILELEERTRRIDKIVDAIVMVTVQTKMLAVNGNVEAARAGEYGRGFSVVAGDIRSLANESSENADKIKDLVKNVQTQITRVAADIELAGSKGRAEVERAKASSANLDRIAKDSDIVVADIREIAKASGEAAAGLEQAGKASEQIAAKLPGLRTRLSKPPRKSPRPSKTSHRKPMNCRMADTRSVPERRLDMDKETLQRSAGDPPSATREESQLVTFLLKEEEFGFDIMSVQEIIRLPKMAKVPRTPPCVDGIANLRGVVLPVIDMRTRFGMERAEETDRTRVLVVDIDGVKTGLRVDRVKQVTRVLRSEIEPPPAAMRGSSSDYLEGVVKLDKGQRIVMALNAAHVCEIGVAGRAAPAKNSSGSGPSLPDARNVQPDRNVNAAAEVQKLVTFRIAKEEFAFHMEHVREILRVQTPNHVPDVPDYVLGVLTVRGQILPVIDLRRLLQQRSLADEFADSGRPLREEYARWLDQTEKLLTGGSQSKIDGSVAEHLRTWLAETNSSSQLLMEALAKARGLNEKVIKQLQLRTKYDERGDRDSARVCGDEVLSGGRETIAALRRFEQLIPQNIQEDQRIIVVDAEGFVLGLVVDHVHEVLNVPKNLMGLPPRITSSGGMELSGVAKLEDGARLIMLLDVANLMKDQKIRDVKKSSHDAVKDVSEARNAGTGAQGLNEIQLVTFMLGAEEFGVPISQIQEIDRLGKITKVPRAAEFIEGITNLRGEVIPVLDTRKRFDLEAKPSDDRTRIIIVDLGGVKTGLVVDSVREVLNLAKKDIAPPPEAIGSGIDQQFISGIGKVDAGKRMIVLLDMERILSRQEQAHLSEIAA